LRQIEPEIRAQPDICAQPSSPATGSTRTSTTAPRSCQNARTRYASSFAPVRVSQLSVSDIGSRAPESGNRKRSPARGAGLFSLCPATGEPRRCHLEYPQSGERIRGRRNIQASRFVQLSRKCFTVRRILGAADLWITEFVITYDARPSYTVSIMEFRDGKVARETQYFGDPFEPGPSRAQWVERMR
jgi:hypothetical protein